MPHANVRRTNRWRRVLGMCSSVSMYRSFLLASGLALLMGCGPTSDDTASEAFVGAGWARFDALGTLAWLDGQAYLCGEDEAVSDSRWFGEEGGAWADTTGSWSFTVADDTVELEGPEASWSGAAYPLDEGALYDTAEDSLGPSSRKTGSSALGAKTTVSTSRSSRSRPSWGFQPLSGSAWSMTPRWSSSSCRSHDR